ncbi:MAG: hypothetical protein WC612_00975 [Bdellovibrionales bacterium]|jgi:flagellar motility protein MotE (MotC chaperone)
MKSPLSLHPRVLLPLMILTAMLLVGVRLGGMWDTVVDGKLYTAVRQVYAAGTDKKEEAKAEAPKSEEPKVTAPKTDEKKSEGEAKKDPAALSSSAPAIKEKQSPENELYRQLQGRREQLDKRAQDLDARESLTLVAEKRIEQKIKEMESLRTQLQTLVGQASEAQQAQLENLVKIYEIMKPKEAAKIFETLELPILLGVVQKMKPARTAAVMAEMNPEKAKEITTALTKQDQLPQVK